MLQIYKKDAILLQFIYIKLTFIYANQSISIEKYYPRTFKKLKIPTKTKTKNLAI